MAIGIGSLVYSDVPDDVQIGAYTIIEPNVVIGKRVKIGDYVRLCSGTIVEDDVFLDSYVCSSGDNRIGARSIARYGTILAADIDIDEDVFLAPRVCFLRPHAKSEFPVTEIGRGVLIGAGAVVDGGVKVANFAKIGAMSFVKKSCLTEGKLYVGQPAFEIGKPAPTPYIKDREEGSSDCGGVGACSGGDCVFVPGDSG